MTSYDPRRSRPTPKVTPDEESAPIDVLLGPDPAPVAAPDGDASSSSGPVDQPPAQPVRTAEARPSPVAQLSPLLAVVVLVLIAWLVRRSRR